MSKHECPVAIDVGMAIEWLGNLPRSNPIGRNRDPEKIVQSAMDKMGISKEVRYDPAFYERWKRFGF